MTMDFSEFWRNLWTTFTCTHGVSCFERYRPPVTQATAHQRIVKNKPSSTTCGSESEWSDEGASESPNNLSARQKSTPLQRHRRKLSKRAKLITVKDGGGSEQRVSIRVSEEGKTLTWSTEKSPRTYAGLLGGITIDDISEVQIDPKNDRVVLVSAFEESFEDDDDDLVRTFTTKFKFRTSDISAQWVVDLDKFLNEFSPPDDKRVLDFQDATGRMSSILDSAVIQTKEM